MAALDLTRTQVPLSWFVEEVFAHLPRTDQRYWAHAYLASLLSTEGKKSVRRLAAAVSDSPTASQSLHQFVNASPWDWAPVRAELARFVQRRLCPRALTLGVAVLRKRGDHSCGVHRRFVPATGRSVNCQVGVGAFMASAGGAVAVDWRLLLPGAWANDPQRRARARIPDTVTAAGLEQHALDLVDALADSALPVVADLSAYAGVGTLIRGLSRRGREFVLAVPGRMPVVPAAASDAPGGSELPAAVEAGRYLELKHNARMRYDVGRAPHDSAGQAQVVSALVRLPQARAAGQAHHRTYRMLGVNHVAGRRSMRLWLTNMPHRRVEDLLALTQLARRASATIQELQEDFGLLDFEGRSFPGWHHHMTLVSAAHAYHHLEPGPLPTAPAASHAL